MQSAIVEYLRDHEPATATEVAQGIGKSRNSVHKPLRKLVEKGVVSRTAPRATGRPGRPAYIFSRATEDETCDAGN